MINKNLLNTAFLIPLIFVSCGVTDPKPDSQMALILSKGRSFTMGDTSSTSSARSQKVDQRIPESMTAEMSTKSSFCFFTINYL